MPTAAYDTISLAGCRPCMRPEWAIQKDFKFPNSTTVLAGTVVGELSGTPGSVKAYASGNGDGSQNPIGVAAYDVTVDGSGNHTWGGQTVTAETRPYAPVWIKGYFSSADLTGMDAAGLAKVGRLVNGSLTTGTVEMY